MSTIPKGDRNRLSKLGVPELQRELGKIEQLKGVRATQEAMKKRFIETLIEEKTKPRNKEPRDLENDRRNNVRRAWDEPFKNILDIVRRQPTPAPSLRFQNYGDVARVAGDVALHTLAKKDIRIRWVNGMNEAVDPSNRRDVCIMPTLPYQTGSYGINAQAFVRKSDHHAVHALEVDDLSMTPEFAGIKLAEEAVVASHKNGIYGMSLGREKDVGEFEIAEPHLRMGITLQAADLLSKGEVRRLALKAREKFGIESYDDLKRIAGDVRSFSSLVTMINRGITRKPPLSAVDQSARSNVALYSMIELMPGMEGDVVNMMQEWRSTEPVDETHLHWPEVLAIIEGMGVDAKDLSFAMTHQRGISFLSRREAMPEGSPLRQYEHSDYEDTLDLAVFHGKETDGSANARRDEKSWISGRLPTLMQVELGNMHEAFDRELARLERRAATIDFTPQEADMLAKMTNMARTFQWYDAKSGTIDDSKIGVGFALDADTGDSYTATGPRREINVKRDARTPAWLMRDVLQMLPVTDGMPHEDASKPVYSALQKLYPIGFTEKKGPDHDTDAFIRSVIAATRSVTRAYPRSDFEAQWRIVSACHDWDSATDDVAKRFSCMSPTPVSREQFPELDEYLEMIDERLLEPNPHVSYATSVFPTERVLFICRKEHAPEELMAYASADTEETLDLVVNLNLQDEDALEADAWISGTMPSIEELERELFVQDFVPEKFFPDIAEKTTTPDTEEGAAGLAETENTGGRESLPLPRLKALRNVLLRNRHKAHFVIDERTAAPTSTQYETVEPGHYVLVSLPDAKLQFLISDDKSKGTFVIRNLIDPEQFTKISLDEFLAQYGATRVRYHDKSQFTSVLDATIRQQIEDPVTVYPVQSSYPTPLDTFPNEEAFAALERDMNVAAAAAGKNSIADLTQSDFNAIPSKNTVWSFGGAACGSAYLDRLATEFGLDASKLTSPLEPVKQYEFRERILRMVLWELSDEYRKARSEHYKERSNRGYWHSVKKQKKRNGHATESVQEETVQ